MNHFDNMPGAFTAPEGDAAPRRRSEKRINRYALLNFFGRISPERWVDIICCSIIGIALIVVAICWQSVMDGLFYGFMLPILKAFAKLLAVLCGALCIGGFIRAKLFRRR